jgi:hypothetical protein
MNPHGNAVAAACFQSVAGLTITAVVMPPAGIVWEVFLSKYNSCGLTVL